MTLQVLQPKFRVQEVLHNIERALLSKWTGMGYLTTEFEEKLNSNLTTGQKI